MLSRSIMFMALLVVSLAPAIAGTIIIEGKIADQKITVRMKQVPLGDVLRKLGKTFSFSIRGLNKINSAEKVTGEIPGTLDVVLLRLLRNHNHMIIRSMPDKSVINHIVLLSGKAGSKPSIMRARQAPIIRPRIDTEQQIANEYPKQ